MSLSALSSPLEQEPNSHAFFIGWVAKYCLIVFIVLVSIIIMCLFCKDTIFLSYWQQIARDFFILRQFNDKCSPRIQLSGAKTPVFSANSSWDLSYLTLLSMGGIYRTTIEILCQLEKQKHLVDKLKTSLKGCTKRSGRIRLRSEQEAKNTRTQSSECRY